MKIAQSMKEYVVVTACVVAVLVSMQKYFKGGIIAKYKSTVSGSLGGQFDPNEGVYKRTEVTKGSSASITSFKLFKDVTSDEQAVVLFSHQSAGYNMTVDKDGNQTFSTNNPQTSGIKTYTAEYSQYDFIKE